MNGVEARLKALEERLRLAQDVLAIQNLMADYSNAAGGGWNRPTHDPDRVAMLFTEAGVWEGDKGGRVEAVAFALNRPAQRVPDASA